MRWLTHKARLLSTHPHTSRPAIESIPSYLSTHLHSFNSITVHHLSTHSPAGVRPPAQDSGEFRGVGFADFGGDEELDAAAAMNGRPCMGRPIRLDWQAPKGN